MYRSLSTSDVERNTETRNNSNKRIVVTQRSWFFYEIKEEGGNQLRKIDMEIL